MVTYDLEAAAAFLHMSKATLCRKARAGEIKAAKPGKRWVFLESDLVAYLEALYAGSRQASLGSCREVILWQSINAAGCGGSGSQHPTGSEYAALLGLKTGNKPSSTTTS
jgi:excisionase family DNA binding protein